jgi:hypothetical protein
MKIKIVAFLFIILFIVAFVSMIMFSKKQYRYECQDPYKYHLPQCQPPLCEVSGLCTKYLIGEVETMPQGETNETN